MQKTSIHLIQNPYLDNINVSFLGGYSILKIRNFISRQIKTQAPKGTLKSPLIEIHAKEISRN